MFKTMDLYLETYLMACDKMRYNSGKGLFWSTPTLVFIQGIKHII